MNTSNDAFECCNKKIEEKAEERAMAEEDNVKELNVAQHSVAAEGGVELDAASALTSLLTCSPPGPKPKEDERHRQEVEPFEIPEKFTRSGRKKATPFPLKLMKVLSCKEYADIITWLPDGKSFSVVCPKAFTKDILPAYFKDAKYSSFTRKLHRWGFQRYLRGEHAGAFFHKDFMRNRLDLVEKMTCYKSSTNDSSGTKPSTKAKAKKAASYAAHKQKDTRRTSSGSAGSSDQFGRAVQEESFSLSKLAKASEADVRKNSDKLLSDDSLDIAIELEVTRRLRERVTAAQVSRQALAEIESRQILARAIEQELRAPLLDPVRLSPMPRLGFGASTLGLNNLLGGGGISSLDIGVNTLQGRLGNLHRSTFGSSSLAKSDIREDEVLRKALQVLDQKSNTRMIRRR